MNADNPWLNSRTAKDFILARKPVTKLTHLIIENLVAEGENAMRRKDVNGLMALLALDFNYLGLEFKNGNLELVEGNRDRFQIGICGTFATSNCTAYSMEITSVELTSPQSAKVTLIVRNPEDAEFIRHYGNGVKEIILVSLYQQRPVISRLEIESAS